MLRKTAERLIRRNDLSRSKWHVCCAPFCVNASQKVETVTKKTHVGEVQIPKKKKRDAYAVLSALSSVVGEDPTRSFYILEDDPFLKPQGKLHLEQFLSAKASGRKAAKTLMNLRPELFETPVINTTSTPSVKAYTPKKFWYKTNEASEEGLLERIYSKEYHDVVAMYSDIQKKDIPLSQQTLQLLLDFVGFFEAKHTLVERKSREPEENYIGSSTNFLSEKGPPVWKSDNVTSQVFESLPEKTPEAYNSMLRTLVEHKSSPELLTIYNEMTTLNIPYERSTYHVILRNILNFPNESNDPNILMNKLKEMHEAGFEPIEETFNSAILGCLRALNKVTEKEVKLALSLLNEMKSLGLEPSMKTWFLLAKVIQCYPSYVAQRHLQHKILDYMQDKEYPIYLENMDTIYNFVIITAYRYKDLDLALKAERLLQVGRNRLIFSHLGQINYFYWNLLYLLIENESVENVLDWIFRLIPSKLEAFPKNLIKHLLSAVSDQEAHHRLPNILDVTRARSFVDLAPDVLKVMAEKSHESELQNAFADYAENLATRYFKEPEPGEYEKPASYGLTADSSCKMMYLFHRADRHEKLWNFFQEVQHHRKNIRGDFRDEEPFKLLLDDSIQRKDQESAIKILDFMSVEDFKLTASLAQKVLSELTLTDSERQHIEVLSKSKMSKHSQKKKKPDTS